MNRVKSIIEAYARFKNSTGSCALPKCQGKPHSMRIIEVERTDEEDHEGLVQIQAIVCAKHDVDGISLSD